MSPSDPIDYKLSRLIDAACCQPSIDVRTAAKLPPPLRYGRTAWIARERPKVDRIAYPWLICRFVDPGAPFLISRMFAAHVAQLEAEFALYRAFHRCCPDAREETHTWRSKRSAS